VCSSSDLLFLEKELDGSVERFESHEFDDDELGQLRELETELAMLLAEANIESIGAALESGKRRGCAGVGEPVGRAARLRGSPVRRPAGDPRPDPDQSPAAALEHDEATTVEGV